MRVATRVSRRAKPARLAPTLGPLVCAWIERCLVHAEGDQFGKPFRLRDWQRRLLFRAYELNADGSRRRRRVLWGFPKGNGKTELAAAVSLVELAGPVVFAGWRPDGRPKAVPRTSPDIPVAAASLDQANLLFGAAKTMVSQGPLRPFCEVYDTKILLKDRPGRLYRVAAVAGTNDGLRPTFFVADELHEWTGLKERVHLVLSNGRAKRADSWELGISTAGWDMQSLLGRMYGYGRRVEAGEEKDEQFLMEWFEAPSDCDLQKPKSLEAAIRQANPALGDFLPLENVQRRIQEIPEFEFRRYHLNQWVSAPERWFPIGEWEGAARPDRQVEDGTAITIGFDGSYSRDATAVVGCTLEGHLFVINVWEKPAGVTDWRVPVGDVRAAIEAASQRWEVLAIGCDPYLWRRELEEWAAAGMPVVEWPSHQPKRMAEACTPFQNAVRDAGLTHDGDPRLARHIANCVVKIDSRGARITKDHKDSTRHIDLAVASVIAFDMALRKRTGPSIYETQDVVMLG